jgi:MATE family multidrug resistance protein
MVFLAFPHAMAGLMSEDPAVIETVMALFVVVAVFQISDGVQAVGAGALRGTGDTTFTFWANIVGHWCIGLPVAWWLGVRGPYGVVGLWWGLSAGLTAVAIALIVRFHRSTLRPVERLG